MNKKILFTILLFLPFVDAASISSWSNVNVTFVDEAFPEGYGNLTCLQCCEVYGGPYGEVWQTKAVKAGACYEGGWMGSYGYCDAEGLGQSRCRVVNIAGDCSAYPASAFCSLYVKPKSIPVYSNSSGESWGLYRIDVSTLTHMPYSVLLNVGDRSYYSCSNSTLFDVYSTSVDWRHSNVTWTWRPMLQSKLNNVSQALCVNSSFDVTGFVQNAYASGVRLVGFAVVSADFTSGGFPAGTAPSLSYDYKICINNSDCEFLCINSYCESPNMNLSAELASDTTPEVNLTLSYSNLSGVARHILYRTDSISWNLISNDSNSVYYWLDNTIQANTTYYYQAKAENNSGNIIGVSNIMNITAKESYETCFDGIRNQDEVAVDCGGRCPPCKPDITLTEEDITWAEA